MSFSKIFLSVFALMLFAGPTRAEPGNLRYDLYQSTTNKNWMTEITTWKRVSDGPPM